MSFFLFPGQGSQKQAMGQDFYERSATAKSVLDEANALFPDGDLLHILFTGAPEEINHTRIAQPGLLAVEVAIARHLMEKGYAPEGCAGHSLGEIPALVIAGALDFEEAFRLTLVRARLMSENVPEGAMAAVMGMDADRIEEFLPKGVQVANFNGPGQTIISGTKAGVEAAGPALIDAGAKRVVPLPVSGPFHSDLMESAANKFAEALAYAPFQNPRIPFISSVTASQVTEAETIRTLLAEQLYSPVRWTEVMAEIGPRPAIEVGPGNVLRGLARRMEGAPSVRCAGMVSDVDKLAESGGE
ncbi:MAG: ACP S-malonyltransferase [Candidatus Hydrogenedentes bacterium]|nr:ACP S-malonyltransferase [Candidatus Hydrogenedentota bacterium]